MDIEMDPKKRYLAAMLACVHSDTFYEQMLKLYDFIIEIEGGGNNTPTARLRKEFAGHMDVAIEMTPLSAPEELDFEELSRACTAYMWCFRTHLFVEENLQMLELGSSVKELIDMLKETSFQHDNV